MTFTPTATLGALVLGAGTAYQIDPDGIGGLGIPPAKTADTVLDGRDGSYAGPDFMGPAVITIPITILAADDAELDTLITALKTGWAPARDGVDVGLVIAGVPGSNGTYAGRARELTLDLTQAKNLTAKALLRFDALTPVPTA